MRKRTKAREFALQILYQMDITRDTPEDALDNFWSAHSAEEIESALKEFASKLVKGAVLHLAEIDKKISQYATNWQLKRMAVVDRNIMRMGCFELIYCEDIPPKVSINEAVDLAKKFSGIEAGKFVNAILDKVKIEKEGAG
ncbi:MAG: transcription antitermination factor NusB [Candidatus Omnitrophica bacterium CG08_land_8_20_14_0_20_41_16]|uniref:Transcription antitermination protein NusB n=1 Tax=Candidatus Sherwoodlollariibacterium unditelluris TaxID=1974757 RepID=A0A2G9YJK5_9BACT|nr:MAG: transcription antitermination factor NusB [Candidatus Omnitrophica bacterium CG23_combo_of_CG06-09_8_20_14_all_41_10]PIS33532.1 MAG: transcription antitermination factor NusB [Candidatus Omnitrophica bacterium CG08_land_8_20_14_0_20_41_16]